MLFILMGVSLCRIMHISHRKWVEWWSPAKMEAGGGVFSLGVHQPEAYSRVDLIKVGDKFGGL